MSATPEQMARMHAVVPAAQLSQRKYGVPASVTLAQWIFESSWGMSQLALKAKNYFGIKAQHLENASTYIEMPTHEFVNGVEKIETADFARYSDAYDSFDGHASLLATASRYRLAMLQRANPDKFAQCLQKAEYSTSPVYAAKLIQAMRDYDLYQYDTLPPATAQEAA